MKLLLSIVAALLLSLPALAQAGAPRGDDVAAGCRKKTRRPGKKKPPPKPDPVPEAAPPAAAPAEASDILDSGEGDLTGLSEGEEGGGAAPPPGASLRRSNRMEFDARLVKGQTATSGAVYLFQRAPRKLPPLLSMRQSYLQQIVEPVLGKDVQDKEE
ncbi:MAG: hypothetical protein P1V51_03160 [Deltaproteobacteria bacterium]|nr:hypothetical protein [Deltaproteobacteria bacterium]